MKARNTITKFLTITFAAALLCGAGLLQPVEAQIGDGSVKFISYTSTGIVPGERVRLCVGNPEESRGSASLSFSFYLAHGTNSLNSVPFHESEWKDVPRGEFRCTDVRREDLKTEGEPETKRAQMFAKVSIIAPAGSEPDAFPSSLEVTADEDQDGQTVQTDSKYRLILVAAQRSKPLIRMGVPPGDRLSLTFYNPKEEGSKPARVTTYVYDSANRLISQTDPVVLLPGQFYTSNIDSDDFRGAIEVGTGLPQVRVSTQMVLMDGSERPVELPFSMERVNKRTGSSYGGNYYTGSVTVSGDGF